MHMLYAFGGVSGSGKSWLRKSHPRLRQLPCIDIADCYRAAEQQGYHSIDWRTALQMFESAVRQALQDGHRELCLEAFFKPRGAQRDRIEALAAQFGLQVGYIWCSAPRHVCWHRCETDPEGATNPQRHAARIRFIQDADESYFEPIPGESLQDVLGGGYHSRQQQRHMPTMGGLRLLSPHTPIV